MNRHAPTAPNTPRVTVITPTYNRAHLLGETIESVMAQDYPNIEYLILDDGSSDNTRALVETYQQRFPGRIEYSHHDNRGEAETVNAGWQRASGDFVMVINSDDPQPPALIRRSVETLLEDPSILVTYPDWQVINADGRAVSQSRLKDYPFSHMVAFAHCFVGPGTMINRRALAETLPRLRNGQYPYISDMECWLNIGLIGRFRHIPEPLAVWRDHAQALTHQKYIRMAEMLVELMDAFFKRTDLPAAIRALEAQAMVSAQGLLAYRECRRLQPKGLTRMLRLLLAHPILSLRFLMTYASLLLTRKTLPS